MRKFRGQAFETMMLVISVIVAIAILGILLGFIGGIGTFGADARTVMSDSMKKVQQRGFGVEVKDKAEFPLGVQYFAKDVVGESPVNPENVKFYCGDTSESLCGSGAGAPIPIATGNTYVGPVVKKITAAVAVCTGDGQFYSVCIGTTSADASTTCVEKCGLT